MTSPRLRLAKVAASYGKLGVLKDISLSVEPGEFVSILGPSGAGKSTLFRLLTGALKPDSGEIEVDGVPLQTGSRCFAFMPQRDALMPWRNILDNTTLGLEVQGMTRQQARRQVEPLFEQFGLTGFETHYPAALSGGMRQRAALLRTVVQNRPMLLLDEPFGALDALTRASMQRWLESMWMQYRWTAMLVTHDVREAVTLSDRIYLLSARPAEIIQTIDIALPRPRHRSSEEAAAIENAILETLLTSHKETSP